MLAAFDPFCPVVPAPTEPARPAPLDWAALKAEIVARLDLRAEFAALGVEFTGQPGTEPGSWECHALGRRDDRPSAVVFASGVYHDSGGDGKDLHLIEFAAKHGRLGPWKDCLKHYADKAGVPVGKIKVKSGGRVADEEYDYQLKTGEVSYRVFRSWLPNGEKDITQRPIDKNGNIVFEKGAMSRIAPLPWRLPYFPDPERGEWLYVCEGEKKCKAMVARGLHATTIHGGARVAAKRWPLVAAYFRGQDVVVLPDNNPVGRDAAEAACSNLNGIASTVRRLDLPGLPRGGDVVDFFAHGGTVERLEALAEACPLWEPGAPAEAFEDDPATRDCTLADLRVTLSENAWIWPGWIPNSALTLLAAEGGIGKTRLLMDWHRRAFNGQPWPDGTWKPTRDQPKVLWVLADGQYEQICDTATQFGIPDEAIIINTMASDPQGGTELQTAEQLADLEARIRRVDPIWVNIDTITNTGDFKTQDSADAKRQYKPLVEIAARCHVPIFCVTHLNASKKVLGRRAVEKVRVVIQLEQPDPGQEDRRKLYVSKSFAKKPAALGVTVSEVGYEYDDKPPIEPEEGAVHPPKKLPPTRLRECMEWLDVYIPPAPASCRVGETRKAAEEAGYDSKLLYRAKDELRIVETINATTGGKSWSKPA